eukprot:CAMPEP_0174251152 /NCGR_PEP_ID=MMETSP0439-20130205/1071_1 /TAXON_ID=0 /ORGANISM="Stereomyxa ramosa, Strain Chinc5" /LENGTH=153 /DNA_ID=CAMNT_0015331393 /DNA_START=66 /DNA_END=524 /DNA_ORIENTATION=-
MESGSGQTWLPDFKRLTTRWVEEMGGFFRDEKEYWTEYFRMNEEEFAKWEKQVYLKKVRQRKHDYLHDIDPVEDIEMGMRSGEGNEGKDGDDGDCGDNGEAVDEEKGEDSGKEKDARNEGEDKSEDESEEKKETSESESGSGDEDEGEDEDEE